MTDWRCGGWTGSINRIARRETRKHLLENPIARRARYGIAHRVLRRFFGFGTFSRFFGLYLAVDFTFAAAETLSARLIPTWLPKWSASGATSETDIKATILNVSSYLLGAQIGLLGVISLALALVTLIAQREESSTDVLVYYHESFSFELVASSVALAAVLSMQLLWPLQFLLHLAGLGTDLQIFKLGLLGLHLAWLLVNLAAAAYFISTTFRFVHQKTREVLRERYIANIVLPRDLTQRLREQLYGVELQNLLGASDDDTNGERPSATFGFDYGEPRNIEIETNFKYPTVLHDVRMTLVRWALARWSARCTDETCQQSAPNSHEFGHRGPLISFALHIDQRLTGQVAWCQRRGGPPLTKLEKVVLRCAFRFRRSYDAD